MEKSAEFEISRYKRTGAYTMPFFHYHDTYEIYYLLSGERYYFIKDRTYRVRRGDLVFIPENVLHKTSVCGDPRHERILINFKLSFLPDAAKAEVAELFAPFAADAAVLRLLPAEQALVEGWLAQMGKEYEEEQLLNKLLLQALLLQFLIFAARELAKRKRVAPENTRSKHQRIYPILDYINANYQNPLRLNDLARRFYLSPSQLSRTFKEVTGFSFVEYVVSLRIREAQKLLRETNLPVIHIAAQTGFENVSHFGRSFKQVAGVAPRKYRMAHRAGRV
ncbi:MAG TPA: AraC family transcriptional regulator [Bacilli bacterium]